MSAAGRPPADPGFRKFVSDRLKEECEAEGLSGRGLAAESGVSIGSVLKALRGEGTPSLESTFKLASALGISVDDLLPESVDALSVPA